MNILNAINTNIWTRIDIFKTRTSTGATWVSGDLSFVLKITVTDTRYQVIFSVKNAGKTIRLTRAQKQACLDALEDRGFPEESFL